MSSFLIMSRRSCNLNLVSGKIQNKYTCKMDLLVLYRVIIDHEGARWHMVVQIPINNTALYVKTSEQQLKFSSLASHSVNIQ